ncbi:large subunit ribosomal protein L6 [Methylomarinovum caldicuralii]|uniref:Large ribosomal subunit protein uL6 n=1 Tax=Methylomarinovum caldicuralii TaxID=438856 RepID=A0AAU9C089_9GAMM|nr:50S ribosomal protein L6 [Methylomarinovum caldicuralii]BCX80520.1 large subunit ribosomal protein L6 [Methylomarinovum caldicuralii]
MSRIANKPIPVPQGVEIKLQGQDIAVKGPKGNLSWQVHDTVEVIMEDGVVRVRPRIEAKQAVAMAGTMRALINNMVTGVSQGFEKKLLLQGVGYRAQVQGRKLNLTLGFSHPVVYEVPEGITIETPSQTEIVVKGADKQKVGQVAAEIRAFRPPEPYKGKGIRYADEHVVRKEAKKK